MKNGSVDEEQMIKVYEEQMTVLQRFYQWIIDSPPLLEIRPPVSDLRAFSSPHSIDASHTYNGNPRLGFLYQHLCEQVIGASQN